MKPTRHQILLAVLVIIGIVQGSDWVLSTMIQGPLQDRRSRINQLQDDIRKRESLLADQRRQKNCGMAGTIDAGRSGSDTLCVSKLAAGRRKEYEASKCHCGSGSPSSRRANDRTIIYRSMPFSVRARGSLAEFNEFLYLFSKAGHLHQITSMTLNPISNTGQFDISLSIETLLLPGRKGNELNSASSTLLASAEFKDYAAIAKDNIFGIGINSADPMQHTIVSGITFSDGKPQVWITEQLIGKVIQVDAGAEFNTVALSGRILEVHDQEVLIETAGDRMLFSIGQPFSAAKLVTAAD